MQAADGLIRRQKTRTAKHDDGVMHVRLLHAQIGFEHFKLKADAARFAAREKFGVVKSQAVGLGLEQIVFRQGSNGV